jgi:hypothetical protein
VINLVLTQEQYKQYQTEKLNALKSLSTGFDGKSRVCARRAAGILAQSCLQHQNPTYNNSNLLVCISDIIAANFLSSTDLTLFSHFLMQVDDSHSLPSDIDLLKDLAQLEINFNIHTKENPHAE